jgi:hypothetical protein
MARRASSRRAGARGELAPARPIGPQAPSLENLRCQPNPPFLKDSGARARLCREGRVMRAARFGSMNRERVGALALVVAAAVGCSEEEPTTPEVPEGATLYGVEMTLSAHCCEAPATEGNLISEVLSRSVDEGVEFPAIEGSATTQPVIDADVDISESAITITYRGAILAETGSFNGYLFQLGGTAPLIRGAALGSATNTPEGAVDVSFTEQSVSINVAGLSVDDGSRIVVDLDLEMPSVPATGTAE